MCIEIIFDTPRTNDPMLELTVNNKPLGETVELPRPTEAELSNDKLTATLDSQLKLNRSSWIALRATGPGHADHPVGSQYAHTNPVYIEVAGKPIDARAEAAYFLKWIDRLALAVRNRDRIPSEELKRHVREQLESARAVYRKLAITADE